MFTAVDRANMSLRNEAYKQTKEGKNWMKIRCAAERREKLEMFSKCFSKRAVRVFQLHSLIVSCLDLCESRDGQWIFIVVSQRHMLSRHLTFASFYSAYSRKTYKHQFSFFLVPRSVWAFFL